MLQKLFGYLRVVYIYHFEECYKLCMQRNVKLANVYLKTYQLEKISFFLMHYILDKVKIYHELFSLNKF